VGVHTGRGPREFQHGHQQAQDGADIVLGKEKKLLAESKGLGGQQEDLVLQQWGHHGLVLGGARRSGVHV
jgi:hypothetical protein